jgi:hypothetical protein
MDRRTDKCFVGEMTSFIGYSIFIHRLYCNSVLFRISRRGNDQLFALLIFSIAYPVAPVL